MARDKQKSDALSTSLLVFSIILTGMECYWQLAPKLAAMGISNDFVNSIFLLYKNYFSVPLKVKGLAFLLLVCSCVFRTGTQVEASWGKIAGFSAVGSLVYFINPDDGAIFTITTAAGLFTAAYGLTLLFRRMKGEDVPDEEEGFKQNERLINTKDSINIPYIYTWKGKQRKGWINCINPFRASMVLGTPGSGKSFAIYNAFIEQMVRKKFCLFVYDYKFPDLTERVITEIAYQKRHENLWKDMPVKPHLYIINFDDPLKSNRSNPIHHSYITDPADTTEIADLVFLNINKGSNEKGFDFFNESAKVYLDALLWFLANYDPDAIYADDGMTVIGSKTDYRNKGKYCTFPHVIEMMAYNYKKVFQILQFTKGLEAKISPFASALEGGAMEQLQGQIASAQIPLGKFVSPALYWVMTGDDFTLDVNNPEDPKIVCMGNNPDRQSIYGTTLALYTSRMFRLVNHKKKLKMGILLDEVPTIFLKGIHETVATIRSNKGAVVLGAQDESQFRLNYGDKEAEVIMNTVGNMFSGSVDGRTAERISKSFGKIYRRKVSQSISDDSMSRSISYQLEELLPASQIVDMSQGTFAGWVKDNFSDRIKQKKFYGEVQSDMVRNEKLDKEFQSVPIITDIFGGQAPEMTKEDEIRLSKMHPTKAGNHDKLYAEFKKELVQEAVQKNFAKVKADVSRICESEYLRTMPLAQQYKMANGEEE